MTLVPASEYAYLLPEIIVAILGGLLIVVDLIWPAYDPETDRSRTWPAYLAIAGLARGGGRRRASLRASPRRSSTASSRSTRSAPSSS